MINQFTGTPTDYEPKVGDGATILYWTDRRAYTIVEVGKRPGQNGNYVILQRDKATPAEGEKWPVTQYDYAPDPNGAKQVFTKRRNGQWIADGSPMKGGTRAALGYRNEYTDPSF